MEEASAFGALPMEIYNKQSSMTGDEGNPLSEGNNGKEPIYSMAGILHFLQTEWTKFEMERSQWDVERAELQARHFTQDQLDTYRECFYLHCKQGRVSTADQLLVVMRSLGFAPHVDEARRYLKEAQAATGDVDFAHFLEILNRHRRAETAERDMLEALKLHDPQGKGTIQVSELRRVLCNQGEKLTAREFEGLLREAGVAQTGAVNYRQIVKTLVTPLPDY